jgi:repressor LexA
MTRRQAQLLDFIKSYRQAHLGACPSYDEMMRGLKLRSKSQVHLLVCGLEARGYVRRRPGLVRSLEVLR